MASTAQQRSINELRARAIRAHGGAGDYFYFCLSLLIVAVVVYGFSFTIGENLIHPAVPRPRVLYVHAFLFSGWLAFFVLQTGLVRWRKIQWHRRIGWFGVGLGTLIPVVGVSTAIVMGRFKTGVLHSTSDVPFLIVPLFDMLCFTSIFPLAVYFRKKPEFHKRLMIVVTCALTAAGFGRFPFQLFPGQFYLGVDLLILLAVARDLVIDHRINRVYRYVLSAFIPAQILVVYIAFHSPPFWLRIAHAVVG